MIANGPTHENEHTPAPWYGKFFDGQGLIASEATGANVAVCYTSEADTLLLAAAPELLDALQSLLSRAAQLDQSPTHDGLANCDALANARAAIAKATGNG